MRPPDPSPPPVDARYLAHLGSLASEAGIDRWGVAPAAVLERARRALVERRDAGLHDTMAFTYRNPERSTDPGRAVRGARAVFVCAMAHPSDALPTYAARTAGPIARYAWEDTYGALRTALGRVVGALRADGWKAVAFADDNSLVDRETAYLAGLGWYGKNANILVKGVGSWFVLGSVVTDAPLPVAAEPAPDGCGACTRCIEHCPTGAIVGPGVIDARRCLSWLLQRPGELAAEFRVAAGDRLYGCDDCQEACPPTVRGGRVVSVRSAARSHVDLLDLLDADDDGVLATWGRWYLAERDPRWARRNALVALGNVLATERLDAPARSHSLAVLERYRDGDDALLAEHAAWARRRADEGTTSTE